MIFCEFTNDHQDVFILVLVSYLMLHIFFSVDARSRFFRRQRAAPKEYILVPYPVQAVAIFPFCLSVLAYYFHFLSNL